MSTEETEHDVPTKVQYEEIKSHSLTPPPPTSHMDKEGPVDKEDHDKDGTQNPSPVYETIPERGRGKKKRESPANGGRSKTHKPLRRNLSDQLASGSLLSLFNRKQSAETNTSLFHNRPASMMDPLENQYKPLPGEAEPINLLELVRKYSNRFPLRVTVEQGFCSNIEEGAISSDEMYNVHFLKYTKVVYMTCSDSPNHLYSVPYNSAVQFALVYNPHNDIQEARRGKTFQTAGNIIALKPLPKVVCATTAFTGPSPNASVEENELLVITSARRPKVLGTPQLKVYSITTGENKKLSMDCAGNFTTFPQSLCLSLPQIVEHVPNPFPAEAIVHIDRTTCNYEYVPECLIGEVVSLTHSSIETTLLATAYSCELEEEDDEVPKPIDIHGVSIFDIPVNLDIEVKVDPLSDEERNILGMATVQLYHSFDPEKLIVCKPFQSSDAYETQLQLHRVVKKNNIFEGVQIEKPQMAFADAMVRSKSTDHLADIKDLLEDTEEALNKESKLPPSIPPREEIQDPTQLTTVKTIPSDYEVPHLSSHPALSSQVLTPLEQTQSVSQDNSSCSPSNSNDSSLKHTPKSSTNSTRADQRGQNQDGSNIGASKTNQQVPVRRSPPIQKTECPKKPPKPATVQKPKRTKHNSLPLNSTLEPPHTGQSEPGVVENTSTNPDQMPRRLTVLGDVSASADTQPVKPVLPPKPKISPKGIRRTGGSAKMKQATIDESEEQRYATSPNSTTTSQPDPPANQSKQLTNTYLELQKQVVALEEANKNSAAELKALKSEQLKQTPLLEQVRGQQEAMLRDIQQLQKELAGLARRRSSRGAGPIQETSRYSREEEKRRQQVAKLDCEQVCSLLDRMSLHQYISKFKQEQVDGGLLLECDSEALVVDLGVTSKLHRAKLLRLIAGEKSVEDTLRK